MGNNTSLLPPYPPPPSYLDLGSLLALAPNEKAWVLAALGTDPLNKVQTILKKPTIARPGLLLSRHELSLAVENVYSDFRSGRMVDDSYIVNLLEAIVDRVRIDGEGVVRAMDQVISLAARMVKGEACQECHVVEYKSPIRGSANLIKHFVGAMEDLVGLAAEKGEEVMLRARTRFSIDKLCTIHEEFETLRYLSGKSEWTDDLDEMWCHEGSNCDTGCWDGGGDDLHLDWCGSRKLE